MSKIKRATRDQLCRRGNFWTEGMTLTEKDLEMLQSLKKRADELGYTPLVRDVPDAGKIKGCFRCWKDAIKAAGLPSEREPEQVKKEWLHGRNTNKYCESAAERNTRLAILQRGIMILQS